MPPFDYGEEFLDKYRKKDEERKQKRVGFSRFKVSKGSSSTFVLLDDQIIQFTEHRIYKDKQNYYKTCLGDDLDCPYCSQATSSKNITTSSVLIIGTVINLTGFEKTEDDGTVKLIRNYKQNLVLKGEARSEFLHQRDKVKRKYGEDKPLLYTVWEARRGDDDKSLNTGSHFDYKGKLTKEKLIEKLKEMGTSKEDNAAWEEFLQPDNYEITFREETLTEARMFLGLPAQNTRVGSSATPPPRESIAAPVSFDMDIDDALLDDDPEVPF